MIMEKRKHHRVDAVNLLSYSCFDKNDRMVEQGMGRTLNVSESGILLETTVSLDLHNIVYVTIAFDEDLVDVKGKVVRNTQSDDSKFNMGIEFFPMDEKRLDFLKKYIDIFKEAI